jgi:diguanylate cyclase (GGDEF)-like protein
MPSDRDTFDPLARRMQDNLRERIAAVLLDRADAIAADTLEVFPYSGSETLDPEYCGRIGQLLMHLLAACVREGRGDAAGGDIDELYRLTVERGLPTRALFTFFYLTERTAIDELALHDGIGATAETWAMVAQHVRRAAFDALGAYTVRAQTQPAGPTITDPLTTLHTRPLLDTVLLKETDRAGRLGHPLSVILFDVDNLSQINQEHGYGIGDKLLERLGILVRAFFRHHDWVARYAEDSIAVLLTGGDADHAADLAERVRSTVEDRLEFLDHRTDRPVRVTLSAGVLNVRPKPGDALDAQRLMTHVEAALDRAKRHGRNRIETAGYASLSS